jgi:hypothetical protein
MTKFEIARRDAGPSAYDLSRSLPTPLIQAQRRGNPFFNFLDNLKSDREQAAFARTLADRLRNEGLENLAAAEALRIRLATGKYKLELLKAVSSETGELTHALFKETEAQTLAFDKETHAIHASRIGAVKEMRQAATDGTYDEEESAELLALAMHMRVEGLANTMANREVAIADANDKFRKTVSFAERQIGQFDL